MKPLRFLNRLKDPRDLWLFLQILSMLIFLPARIRRLSLPDLLTQLDPGVAPVAKDKNKLVKTASFVESLLKYRIFQRYGKCLLRSLILFNFLRRQGWPVEIHFGVRKSNEDVTDITGHSWLVLAGEIFLEDNAEFDYSETYSYPRTSTAGGV